MVDRKARDQIAAALQSYMDERITAFELNEALWEIATPDKTAREIIYALWFFYDDITDHSIVASRDDWDYFNRLLLLLQSEGELENAKTQHRWTIRQCIAMICLFLFVP